MTHVRWFHVELFALGVISVLLAVVELLIEDYSWVEVLLNASLYDGWPVVTDVLELGVVILYPLCVGAHFLLQRVPHPLEARRIKLSAHEVAHFDGNAAEEAQVVPTLTEADHAPDDIVLLLLQALVEDIVKVIVFGY